MNNLYSKKVNDLANQENNIIIVPDLIMVKDGVSCGDKIVILGQLDDNILKFNFYSENSCILTRASCSFIQNNYNNKHISKIEKEIEDYNKNIVNDKSFLYEEFDLDYKKYINRFDCLYFPISFFIDFISAIQKVEESFDSKPYTLSTMSCDACTGACKINWKNQKIVKTDHLKGKLFPTNYLKKWMPYAKVDLTQKEIYSLKHDIKKINDDDYQFLSDYTINSFVLNNILKYCPNQINKSWKSTAYLIQKNEILSKQFQMILDYLKYANYKIYPIKGYITQNLYENPAIRIHSDFDLIAENDKDAFKFMNYLLNNGFTIRPNLFSIKNVYNSDTKKNCLSGHFHLQKIIDDIYNFEIDLIFPGFPINRVEVFKPKVINNQLAIECQMIVTLLHLFKHSNVFMKDINDIYYMLNSRKNDLKYLKTLLDKFDLNSYFELVISYIFKNYNVDVNYFKDILDYYNIDLDILKRFPDWPYDLNSHLKIKIVDYEKRTKEVKEEERIYLYPIIIFKDILNIKSYLNKFKKNFNIRKVSNSIYYLTHGRYELYLTDIGIFIENYINTKNITRNGYIGLIEKILNDIPNIKLLPIPYAIEHFYVRVI